MTAATGPVFAEQFQRAESPLRRLPSLLGGREGGIGRAEAGAVAVVSATLPQRLRAVPVLKHCLVAVIDGVKHIRDDGEDGTAVAPAGWFVALRAGERPNIANLPDPATGRYRAVALTFDRETLAVPEARGKLVIDTSTVAPETAREAASMLEKVGARFVDAPITGGTEGARTGKLTFMVGGEAADFAEAQPLFAVMGARSLHMGELGTGQATKAVNQVMAAGVAQAVTEGLAFAQALKLPMSQVIEAVGSGAAGSWFVQNRGRTMVNGEYPPGFKVALHLKDLTICQRLAAELGGDLPCVDTTLAQYQTLVAEGHGEEDISALYRLNRRLFPQ